MNAAVQRAILRGGSGSRLGLLTAAALKPLPDAAFLGRDADLDKDPNYIGSRARLRFIPGAARAARPSRTST